MCCTGAFRRFHLAGCWRMGFRPPCARTRPLSYRCPQPPPTSPIIALGAGDSTAAAETRSPTAPRSASTRPVRPPSRPPPLSARAPAPHAITTAYPRPSSASTYHPTTPSPPFTSTPSTPSTPPPFSRSLSCHPPHPPHASRWYPPHCPQPAPATVATAATSPAIFHAPPASLSYTVAAHITHFRRQSAIFGQSPRRTPSQPPPPRQPPGRPPTHTPSAPFAAAAMAVLCSTRTSPAASMLSCTSCGRLDQEHSRGDSSLSWSRTWTYTSHTARTLPQASTLAREATAFEWRAVIMG